MSRIVDTTSWRVPVPLKRPYTIAGETRSAVDLIYFRLRDTDGRIGLGSASPSARVTGESLDACSAALAEDALDWLVGEDPRHLGRLVHLARHHMAATPAALAAVDMALHDLFARRLGIPLVDFFGRRRKEPLETSITLGIQSTEDALRNAEDYLARGFRCLKVKIGLDMEEDRERLTRLRESVGADVRIRVDGNEGYSSEQAEDLPSLIEKLDLELVEQPLARTAEDDQRRLEPALRPRLAADESVHSAADAIRLLAPPAACNILVVKLMKSGGPSGALDIATVAQATGCELMWGCMDESVISIAAALHTAYACERTRYLDLDGSFDLAQDLAEGGFLLDQGRLRLTDQPGLGVSLRQEL